MGLRKQLEKAVNQGRGMTMKIVVQIKLTEAEVQGKQDTEKTTGKVFSGQ